MEVQSQEVKKLFEEYNKMVQTFDGKGGVICLICTLFYYPAHRKHLFTCS